MSLLKEYCVSPKTSQLPSQ